MVGEFFYGDAYKLICAFGFVVVLAPSCVAIGAVEVYCEFSAEVGCVNP